jgi:uncharacterized protein YbdZ (MbtH family)
MCGERYTCMERGTHVWREVHMYGERYTCMERGTHVWREVHMYGERYTCMERGTHVWREVHMYAERYTCMHVCKCYGERGIIYAHKIREECLWARTERPLFELLPIATVPVV